MDSDRTRLPRHLVRLRDGRVDLIDAVGLYFTDVGDPINQTGHAGHVTNYRPDRCSHGLIGLLTL